MTGSVAVAASAALAFDNAAPQTYAGKISGAGSLVMVGSSLLALTNNSNAYAGGTILDNGTLNFSASGVPLSANAITFNGGILQWGIGNTRDVSASIASIAAGQAAAIDTNANNVTFASGLNGPGSLTKYGAGTLTLTGSNTYGGGTVVNVGALLATTTAALPGYLTSGSISVNSAGTLAVEAGANANEFRSTDLNSVLANTAFAPGSSFGIQVVSPQTFTYGSSISGAKGW